MSIILPTPSIIPFSPFDPTKGQTVEFLYSGNQAVKNRVVITDNATNVTVYDTTQETMELKHKIPTTNNLVAGKKYEIRVQVFDADDNSSNLSEPILFYCFSTPVFAFSSITSGQTYQNASLALKVEYNQAEGEKLRNVQFLQYSHDKVLVTQSDVFYSSTSYSFYGLEDNTTYYFRAIGETINGMQLDTGYVAINIRYNLLPANLVLQITNNYCEGYIQLASGIKDIDYITANEQYELNGETLVLTDNSLSYQNLDVEGDFTLFVEAKKLPVANFLVANNNEFILSVINVCGVYYCRLNVKDSNLVITAPLSKAQFSDYMKTTNDGDIKIIDFADDNVIINVGRIGYDYSLNVYYRSEINT